MLLVTIIFYYTIKIIEHSDEYIYGPTDCLLVTSSRQQHSIRLDFCHFGQHLSPVTKIEDYSTLVAHFAVLVLFYFSMNRTIEPLKSIQKH